MTTKKKSQPKAVSPVPRFTKIDAEQVLDTQTGLIWVIATLGERVDHAHAIKTAADCRIGGNTDWHLPTIQELLSLVDYSKHSPAIDTDAFPDTHPNWYCSSSPASWSRSGAWGVFFDGGGSGAYGRDYGGFVRAVRSASASQ